MELVKLIAKDQTQGLVNTGTLVSRARATAAVETTHLDLKSLTVVVQGSGIHVRALKRLGTIQLRVDIRQRVGQALDLEGRKVGLELVRTHPELGLVGSRRHVSATGFH